MRATRDGESLVVDFDPTAFQTVASGIEHARVAQDVLHAVIRTMEARLPGLDRAVALWVMTAAQRAIGLHVALVRETSWDNQHAAFALLRALADTVLVALQVQRDPSYVHVVTRDPASNPTGRRRKTPQGLIAAAKRDLPGMADAWAYLSESGGHFGWAAFQTSINPRRQSDGSTRVTVSTGPGWRHNTMKLASYRHTTELTMVMAVALAGIIGTDVLDAIRAAQDPPSDKPNGC